ncbi:MAG: DNA topoisomerase IV subunit A, partial [Verrucomicrobiota bacterium]
RQDIEKILKDLDQVQKNLKALTPYAIRFLKGLIKEYGAQHPRRTRIKSFGNLEVRELTSEELTVKIDRKKGYMGFKVQGDDALVCSSLDKILLVWDDGRYKVVAPPDKIFVDQNLIYYAIMDREKVMTVVYTDHLLTCLKRFSFGGAILNKDYSCTSPEGRVILFDDSQPEEIYLKYSPAKGQRIHQQVFKTSKAAVKGVKAKGVQLTVKKIKSISTKKPRNWDESAVGSQGAVI